MCAGWAVVRLFGLESGYPAVALMTYTLYVLMVAIVAAVLALGLRQWLAAAFAVFAVAALGAVIAPRAIGGPDDVEGTPVRVMSANVFHGNGDAGTLARFARDHQVDLLCVEELTPEFAAGLDEAGIGNLLPSHVLSVREGVFGSGIYSRYPLRRLPLEGITSSRAEAMLGLGRKLDIGAIHNLPLPASQKGTDGWAQSLTRMPAPTPGGPVQVLAGDFNATLDQSEFGDLLDRGYYDAAERMGDGLIPTWPEIRARARYLPVTIDHILYDRDRIGIKDFQVMTLPGSDHRTIYAELVLSR